MSKTVFFYFAKMSLFLLLILSAVLIDFQTLFSSLRATFYWDTIHATVTDVQKKPQIWSYRVGYTRSRYQMFYTYTIQGKNYRGSSNCTQFFNRKFTKDQMIRIAVDPKNETKNYLPCYSDPLRTSVLLFALWLMIPSTATKKDPLSYFNDWIEKKSSLSKKNQYRIWALSLLLLTAVVLGFVWLI